MNAIFCSLCALEGTSTMLQKSISAAVLLLTFASVGAFADTLIVDGIQQQDVSSHPDRGLTKASVTSSWGEPANQIQAIGEPPISSWEYDTFVVYFESDYVLHTVVKR